MSRRKQAKPQQHVGVESGESSKNIELETELRVEAPALPNGNPINMHLEERTKVDSAAEKPDDRNIHVCSNCQGEFVGFAALMQHKEHCDKNPVVLIMNDEHKMTTEPPRSQEPATEPEQTKNTSDAGELSSSEQKAAETIPEPPSQPMDYSSRDDEEKEQRFDPHRGYPSGLALLQEATQRARYDMSRYEESLMKLGVEQPRYEMNAPDFEPSRMRFEPRRHSFDGTFSPFENFQARFEVSHAKYDQALSSQQSEHPSPAVEKERRTEATLGRLNGSKIPSLEDVTAIQDQLYKLHQQHIEQLQLIQQIQQQIQTLVSVSLQAPKEPARENKDAAPKQPAMPKVSLPGETEPISVPSRHQTPTALSHPVMPSSLEILQNQSRHASSSLPYPPFPLPPPRHSPFDVFQPQNPLTSISNPLQVPPPLPYPGGLLAHRKGKPPNVSVFDPKFTDDAFFRHKCHFCHKVFGSDSALQIHIRSHTGERPFKCNICGNRFSTKGNLKVHFQRHQAAYPEVEMDVTPHPPSPTSSDRPLQPPSIDQIPMSTIPSDSKPHLGLDSMMRERNGWNSSESREMEEVNNNEKTLDILKNATKSKLDERRDELEPEEIAPESGRPNSAPSKVLSVSSPNEPMPLQPPPSRSAEELCRSTEELSRIKVPFLSMPCSSMMDPSDFISRASETSKLQDLVESIEQKITEPNQCVICHRVLSCKSALQLHYRIHTGERPFKCKICCRTFTTKGNLKNHLGVHHRHPVRESHECPICQKTFGNPVVLQQHLKLHAAEEYMMPRKSHEMLHPVKPYHEPMSHEDRQYVEGNFMESLRARFGDLRSHLMMNGNYKEEEKMDARKPDRDEDEETEMKRLKTEHEQKTETMDSASVTGEKNGEEENEVAQERPSEEQLREERVEVNSEASECCAPSPNSEERKLHIDENSQDEDMNMDMNLRMSSGSASAEIARMNALYAASNGQNVPHSESIGSASPENVPHSESCGSDISKCSDGLPVFDPAFPSFLMGRRLHSRSNTMCHYCGKTFACASALNIHYRSHTKERPFKCDCCGKGFSTRGNLKQHMLTHKIRDMPSQILGLPPSPPSVSPPPAEVSVAATARLKLSPTNSSDDGSKRSVSCRHSCSVCGKQFQSDSALQIHVRTHTGEKPYKCHICGRAFTTKGNMKVHLGTHMWNGGSRRGRRITLDNPLMMNPKEGDIFRNDFMGFRPGFDFPFFHYPTPYPMVNGFNPLAKSNEISVIQNPHSSGMPLPPSSEALLMKAHRASPGRDGYLSSVEKLRNGIQESRRSESTPPSSDLVRHALLSPGGSRESNGDLKHSGYAHLSSTSPGLAANYLRHQSEYLEKQHLNHSEGFSPRYIPYGHDTSPPSDMKSGTFSRSSASSPGAAISRSNAESNGDLKVAINFPRPGSSSPGSASREPRTSPYIPSSSASSHGKFSQSEGYEYMRHGMESLNEDSLKGASRLVEQIQAQRV